MLEQLTVKVKTAPAYAGLPLPEYASEAAAGLDLLACLAPEEELVLQPGQRIIGAKLALFWLIWGRSLLWCGAVCALLSWCLPVICGLAGSRRWSFPPASAARVVLAIQAYNKAWLHMLNRWRCWHAFKSAFGQTDY